MKKIKKYCTDFLFATPSYITGAGSVLNLSGNYYEFNTSPSGEIADMRALESDWGMVGQDFDEAIRKYESTSQKADLICG